MAKRTRVLCGSGGDQPILQLLCGSSDGGGHQDVFSVVANSLDPLTLHTLRRVSRHTLGLIDSLALSKRPVVLVMSQRCHPCGSQNVRHDCPTQPHACWRRSTRPGLDSERGTFLTSVNSNEFRVAWSSSRRFMDIHVRHRVLVEWHQSDRWLQDFAVHANGTVVYYTNEGDGLGGRFRQGTALVDVKLVYQ